MAEIVKQCRTARLPISFFHLRTADGREVDLLIEREDGFMAIECKQATRTSPADFRGLRDLDSILTKPLLLGAVVSGDRSLRPVRESPIPLWNVSAAALLA